MSHSKNSESVCEACQCAKSHQLPYPKSNSVSHALLELIFSDVCDHARDSFGKNKYYVSFIDDYSKFTWIYLLKYKSEVFSIFQEIQKLVERYFNRKILTVQSDWGGEYEKLNSFFHSIGIQHHVSLPHAHQQNGSAERKHRHIVEVGLSLLAHASMPLKYWDEAFITATYLINRLPSRVIGNSTPLERLYHQKSDYNSLKNFGCACYPNLRPYNHNKLVFHLTQCVFLGYSTLHKGYKCLEIATGRIYISRDVVFDETLFPFAKLHPNAGALLRAEIELLPDLDTISDHVGELDKADHVNKSIENCISNDVCAGAAHDFMWTETAKAAAVACPVEDLASRRSGAGSQENHGASAIIGAQSEEDSLLLQASGDPVADITEPTSPGGGGDDSPLATSPRPTGSGDTRRASAGGPIPRWISPPGDLAQDFVAAGSSVAGSSAAPRVLRRHTRSQSGIIKEKEYKDGTIRYDKKRAFLTTVGEPVNLVDALTHKDWKEAMDSSMTHL